MNKRISMIILTLMCVMFISNVAFAEELEINDGKTHTVSMNTKNDTVEKTFSLSKKGTFTLKVKTTMTKCNLYLYAKNEDGEYRGVTYYYYNGSDSFETDITQLMAGEYKLIFNEYGNYAGNITYSISFNEANVTYNTSANNVFEGAIEVGYGITVNEFLATGLGSKYEYYSFTMPNDGLVKLNYKLNTDRIYMYLYNQYGTHITYYYLHDYDGYATKYLYLNKGTYVMCFQPTEYGAFYFDLNYTKSNITKETDNYTFNDAYQLKYGDTFKGVMTENFDNEYYKLTIKDKDEVAFIIDCDYDDPDMNIYDQNQDYVSSAYGKIADNKYYYSCTLEPGTYYLNFNYFIGNFTMKVGKDISKATMSLSNLVYTYNGSACKPTVTVKNGSKKLVSGTDYTVSYKNNTNPGVATVTVTGKGDYVGTISKSYTINKISMSKTTSKLSFATTTYSNAYKKPSVTVTYNKKTLKLNTDYTVSYANNKYPGTATVTVKGKGNYTGTVKKTFKISAPNLSSTSKVTVVLTGHDDVKISWKKVSGATGYYVYYKTSSMKSYKKLGSTTALTYKKSNLEDGKKYVFRIYPYVKINGKNYQDSSWKNSNTITTLKKISTPKVTKSSSGKVKVSWTNIAGETGYQISKSTSKTKTSIVSTYNTTSGKSKVIKASRKKTYYYKVRAYKTVNGKKIYGPWSNVKAYKLK